MSPITVAQLVAEPSLRLRVLVPTAIHELVRGAHISDLGRPGRYVLPGEAVLTNGLWLADVTADDWIASVRMAGAVAVGFGVSDALRAVPPALVEACERAGMPLVEVPQEISFSALSEQIHARNTADHASSRLQLLRLRRLMSHLARGEGHDAVVDLLRRETRLPVWLIGPGGRSMTADVLPDKAAALTAARAARRGELPCTVNGTLSAFAGTPSSSMTTVLIGASMSEVEDDARLVVEQVAAYVAMEDARRAEGREQRARLAAELLHLSWDSEIGAAAFRRRLEALGLDPSGPLTVASSPNGFEDLVYATLACRAPSLVTRHEGRRFVLLQNASDALMEQFAEFVRDGGSDPVLGYTVADPGPAGLRFAMAVASSAVELAATRPPGQRVRRDLGVATHQDLLTFIAPHLRTAFSSAVLACVEQWDEDHDAQLLVTLAAFLENNCQLRRTAAQLHVHHNTLNYRLDQIAQLTARDPRTTQGRVDFALALAVAGRDDADSSPAALVERQPPEPDF